MEEKLTFDPMAWVNNETENKESNPQKQAQTTPPANTGDDYAKAEAVVVELERLAADITTTEPDWFRVGLALANGLGEAGGELFHRVSRLYPNYSESECEKKWQHALKSNDGRVSFSTFFYLAQQAGVNLSDIGRQFPSVPSFPQCEGKTGNHDEISIPEDSNISLKGEGSEGFEGNYQNDEGNVSYTKTFSDRLDRDKMSPIMKDVMDTQETPEQQDTMVLGTLTVLSGNCPNVYGRYGRKKVYAPFYSLINAPAASEKGQLSACEKLADPIEREIQANNRREREAYEAAVAQYEMLDRATKKVTPPPKEPPYRSMHIPLDSSSTACYQALSDNDGTGLSFETEADVLTQALKSDYGDYSSGLRRAFHHERISYNRRKDNEHVNIREPRWAILLTCTPSQIPLLFSSNVENGMASRFMFYNLRQRLDWHDPFYREPLSIDEQFLKLGERFYPIYRKLSERKDRPIEFLLSVEQQQEFNSYFEALQLEQFSLLGEDLVAFVRRLGLVCFRLAMVLTVLRYEEHPELLDEPSQSVVCSYDDFQTAMTIVDVLISHTAHVYANYLGNATTDNTATAVGIKPQEKALLDALTSEFSTTDCRQAAQRMGIQWKTAERYLGQLVNKYHLVDRVKNGQYRKR